MSDNARSQDPKPNVYEVVSEMQRKALAQEYANRGIERARGALERGRPASALGYLIEANEATQRLGGQA